MCGQKLKHCKARSLVQSGRLSLEGPLESADSGIEGGQGCSEGLESSQRNAIFMSLTEASQSCKTGGKSGERLKCSSETNAMIASRLAIELLSASLSKFRECGRG